MKTFNDLKPGDYIYELDVVSCNVECIKTRKFLDVDGGIICSNENHFPIVLPRNNTTKSNILGVVYYCNKEECLNKLSKLIKRHQTAYKNAKQNIQKLKEL